MMTTRPGNTPRHTAKQGPPPSFVLRQVVAADENRHPACDLAHRLQERQPPAKGDGFVSDRGAICRQQLLGVSGLLAARCR